MKTRHIIAISLLSATAIGILAIGIKTNKKTKKEKPLQTNAYELTEFEQIENTYSYSIQGQSNGNYIQADAINYYNFTYYWEISCNPENNPIITATTTLYKLETDRTEDPIYINLTSTETRNISPKSITWYEISQSNFSIINSYYLNIDLDIDIHYRVGNITRIENMYFGYSYVLNETYPDFRQVQKDTLEQINITNTINTILYYGQQKYEQGVNDGIAEYEDDYAEGYEDGKQYGYATGWNDSDAFNHPIAIQPLMLQILSLPFTFITKAFDVTLWPGTAYEFNFSNFIKGLIAIASIMFIIKIFTSGFAVFGNYTGRIQQNKLTKSQIKLNKAKTNLANRTDPNNKTKTNVNINKKG